MFIDIVYIIYTINYTENVTSVFAAQRHVLDLGKASKSLYKTPQIQLKEKVCDFIIQRKYIANWLLLAIHCMCLHVSTSFCIAFCSGILRIKEVTLGRDSASSRNLKPEGKCCIHLVK